MPPPFFCSCINAIYDIYVIYVVDVGVDVELVFRSCLDQLFLHGGGNSSFGASSSQSRIIDLLNFAIELGKVCEPMSFNIPKIPFILIEDLLQCQTLANAFLIWEIVAGIWLIRFKGPMTNREKDK